jgi:hypothetical protein
MGRSAASNAPAHHGSPSSIVGAEPVDDARAFAGVFHAAPPWITIIGAEPAVPNRQSRREDAEGRRKYYPVPGIVP